MWDELSRGYMSKTCLLAKAIDVYLLYTVATGLIMMLYCLAFAPHPYNSFLASFLNSVGCFVLAGIPSSASF